MQCNICIHLESCVCPPDECKSNIHSPFGSVFGLHSLLREIQYFSALAANFVCLLFGAGHVAEVVQRLSGYILHIFLSIYNLSS